MHPVVKDEVLAGGATLHDDDDEQHPADRIARSADGEQRSHRGHRHHAVDGPTRLITAGRPGALPAGLVRLMACPITIVRLAGSRGTSSTSWWRCSPGWASACSALGSSRCGDGRAVNGGQTPVNLLTFDGRRYLVAPRGETQWVRNLRAAGTGELRLGRRAESFRGRELTARRKSPSCAPISGGGRQRSGFFFEGTGPDSDDDQIRAIAPKHPAFEVLGVN